MIAFLLGFFKVWGFKMLIYAGILAGMGSFMLWQRSKIGQLEAEAMRLRQDRSYLEGNVKVLQGAITEQNEMIAKWRDEAIEQEKSVRKAQAEALTVRKAYAKRSIEILRTPVPKEHREAVEWLAGKAQEQAQW